MTALMQHRTSVLEKHFNVSPARVFAAWADLEQRAKWNSPSDDVVIRYTEDDFSVGGKDVSLCLVGDYIVAEVVGIYHHIATDEQIIYTEIIKSEDQVQGVSQVSVSIAPDGDGTHMVVTLQTAAVSGSEILDDVAAGWTAAIAKMQAVLEA
ncbi:SRPBCC domain-containing protein [Ponticaulis koreensis]|uniref:SRPBCC domain-containing protein n=1 Tax=Ponticaulis koreensis TaxID=1123045 RepID=UPI0003B748BA|nr:SRPBCC domain-containing protein [Ponticaulis koreensis]